MLVRDSTWREREKLTKTLASGAPSPSFQSSAQSLVSENRSCLSMISNDVSNGRRGVQVSSVLQETIQGRSRTENQAAADDLKALLQGTSEGSHDESASVPETHMEETAALEGEISEEVQETATLVRPIQ